MRSSESQGGVGGRRRRPGERVRGWWERNARLPGARVSPRLLLRVRPLLRRGPVARPEADRARTTGQRQSRRRGDTRTLQARRAWRRAELALVRSRDAPGPALGLGGRLLVVLVVVIDVGVD